MRSLKGWWRPIAGWHLAFVQVMIKIQLLQNIINTRDYGNKIDGVVIFGRTKRQIMCNLTVIDRFHMTNWPSQSYSQEFQNWSALIAAFRSIHADSFKQFRRPALNWGDIRPNNPHWHNYWYSHLKHSVLAWIGPLNQNFTFLASIVKMEHFKL